MEFTVFIFTLETEVLKMELSGVETTLLLDIEEVFERLNISFSIGAFLRC
jgi:hypothetical protein